MKLPSSCGNVDFFLVFDTVQNFFCEAAAGCLVAITVAAKV